MLRFAWLLAVCSPLLATSTGEPIRRTGAAVDGGLDCSACHRGTPVNQGNGRVLVRANSYVPGVRQGITIEITDPVALRWGFQITSRQVNDESKQAGTFTPTENIRVLCDATGEAPCNGAGEFATHTAANTRSGTPGPQQTFLLEWTAPGRDVGPVVFYAAAMGSDNSR
ncbi:MAG: choice-of-anchor V domain-containing protein, partial [Bryobacteraceae bacterium]